MLRARFALLSSTAEIVTVPLSSMSILAPVSSVMPLIVLPPGPMIMPINSGSILIVSRRGANGDISVRGCLITSSIFFRMCNRAGRACSIALAIISKGSPESFISICKAVIPSSVPATLKSISPKKSSMPWMSVRTRTSSPSLIRPIAAPLTGLVIGTPASINANVEPQTDPIEVEPLEERTSDTTRIT